MLGVVVDMFQDLLRESKKKQVSRSVIRFLLPACQHVSIVVSRYNSLKSEEGTHMWNSQPSNPSILRDRGLQAFS